MLVKNYFGEVVRGQVPLQKAIPSLDAPLRQVWGLKGAQEPATMELNGKSSRSKRSAKTGVSDDSMGSKSSEFRNLNEIYDRICAQSLFAGNSAYKRTPLTALKFDLDDLCLTDHLQTIEMLSKSVLHNNFFYTLNAPKLRKMMHELATAQLPSYYKRVNYYYDEDYEFCKFQLENELGLDWIDRVYRWNRWVGEPTTKPYKYALMNFPSFGKPSNHAIESLSGDRILGNLLHESKECLLPHAGMRRIFCNLNPKVKVLDEQHYQYMLYVPQNLDQGCIEVTKQDTHVKCSQITSQVHNVFSQPGHFCDYKTRRTHIQKVPPPPNFGLLTYFEVGGQQVPFICHKNGMVKHVKGTLALNGSTLETTQLRGVLNETIVHT